MANLKVSLIIHCKTANGWRRFPAVRGANGRIRPGFAMIDGKPEKFEQFKYQLRSYVGSKMVYTTVGEDAQDASAQQSVEQRKLVAKHEAKAAGVQVVEDHSRVTIRKATDDYVRRAINKRSMVGAEVYRRSFDLFLESTDLTYIDEIQEDHMLAFHGHLRRRGNSERTVANRHGHLKSLLLHHGVNRKHIGTPPKFEKKLPRVYDRDEISTMLAACDHPYFRLVLDVLRMTGLREAEAAHLMWQDVDFRRGLLLVRSKPDMKFEIKDRAERDVPLPDELAAKLREWRKEHPNTRLVIGNDDDTVHTKWLRLLKRLARKAGLNCGRCRTCRETNGAECQMYVLHSFRRSYATSLDDAGFPIRTIMSLLGHSDIQTTLAYLGDRGTKNAQQLMKRVAWS
jgi:integrase